MASKRYVVARAEELPDGARKIVSVDNREIGVFNIGGRYYALRNNCPHKNGPLCRGRLRPLVISSGVYQIDYQQEGLVLKCPWHQWEFDLATGQALCTWSEDGPSAGCDPSPPLLICTPHEENTDDHSPVHYPTPQSTGPRAD